MTNIDNMKNKLSIILAILCTMPGIIDAQKSITLRECYDQAMKRSSLAGESNAYSGISYLNDRNLRNGWLPTLDANASAVYNSNVVDFSKSLGAIPGIAKFLIPVPHDQYKVTLDINQVIYDGGTIRRGREVEKIDRNINSKQTETDMYKLKEQVNNCYFAVLLLDRQREILRNFLALLNKRILTMQSAVDNGTVIRSDIEVLQSEKIKTEQQITEIRLRKESFLKVLSDITGNPADSSSVFLLPSPAGEMNGELQRPELQLFDLKKEKLAAAIRLEQTKRMPRAFGYATLGYGKPPGQNFLSDSFGPYYMVGGGIKWNIFDWNRVRNQKQILGIQKEILENRKLDLTDNLRRTLEIKKSEILSLLELVRSDQELIKLRKKISETAESKYENGIITATEYLDALNAEQQVEINTEIHKVNLALARIEYLNISGNEIE